MIKLLPEIKYALGQITGWNPGIDEYEGMMGSLTIKTIIEDKEIVFNLSGFTDEQRQLSKGSLDRKWRREPINFKFGQIIEFKYVYLTRDGVPKEAEYTKFYIGEEL